MPFVRPSRHLTLDGNKVRKCIKCARRAKKGSVKCHSCAYHEAKATEQADEARKSAAKL